MYIYWFEVVRLYLLRSFGKLLLLLVDEIVMSFLKKKVVYKMVKVLEVEREENLGLLFGVLRLFFDSWVDYFDVVEFDRRVWVWYCVICLEVDSGLNGWGGKGLVKLVDFLKLR